MKKNPELHKEQLLQALRSTCGLVTPACEAVGISRNQFYNYYKTDSDFKAEVDDIDNMVLDFVEGELFKKIKEGDSQSIMFFMKYKARKRGYSDKIEIDGNINHNHNITVIKLNGQDGITD